LSFDVERTGEKFRLVLTELHSAKELKGKFCSVKCAVLSGLLFDSKYRNLADIERNILSDLDKSDLNLSILDEHLSAVLSIAASSVGEFVTNQSSINATLEYSI
jgi:hypothetical protein